MQRSVRWSKRARINYNAVVDYLISEWGEKITSEFADKTETCIDVLRQYPFIGRKSEKREGIRKVLITKHNLLIYKVSNSEINILNIFDTRQDPNKSKY
jgi:plasmid stabilization system protein ParE